MGTVGRKGFNQSLSQPRTRRRRRGVQVKLGVFCTWGRRGMFWGANRPCTLNLPLGVRAKMGDQPSLCSSVSPVP